MATKTGQSRDTDNIEHTKHRTNKRQRKQKWQSRLDNQETLATLGTQDTRQINVRENRSGNQDWIIKRHWQHWAHKTQDK